MLAPGSESVVGIVGGGQLGRMVALEARRLGLRTCVLDPDPASPAAQVADAHLRGGLQDAAAARELARRCAVVTYEFENVSAQAAEAAEAAGVLRPGSAILRVAQDRVREKEAVAGLGFAVPRFRAVRDAGELAAALADPGLPLVLKTATAGYDGKGQAVVRTAPEAREAFARLRRGCSCLIAEELVDLQLELSVLCARDADGRVAAYAPAENRHVRGILDLTVAPARVPPELAERARTIAVGVAEGLGVVGLLAVEMFWARDGRLLVNELAPRPHNSGHHTLDACPTSQFEQLLRAICGLPLGETRLHRPAAMANLLGDLWPGVGGGGSDGGRPAAGLPNLAVALEVPGVKLHLYGKAEARPGRKMGHLTALGDTVEEAAARVLRARDRICGAIA